MELNATIFVQSINFFIAWFLLRKLYFEPAIAYLAKQDTEQQQLLQTIRRWQSEIQLKEHEISHLWRTLKKYSKEHQPEPVPELFAFKDLLPSVKPVALDMQHIDKETQQLKNAIKTEVTHVNV